MGNKSSVLPDESDGVREEKPKAQQQRRKESYKDTTSTPKAPRPRGRSDNSESTPKAKDADTEALGTTKPAEVASTPERTEPVPNEAVDSRADPRTTEDSGSARRGDKSDAGSGPGHLSSQENSGPSSNGKSQKSDVGQGRKRDSDDRQERKTSRSSGEYQARRGGSTEETASEELSSGSSSGSGSYSPSYSSGSEDSDDDEASDDTFFVPEVSLCIQHRERNGHLSLGSP